MSEGNEGVGFKPGMQPGSPEAQSDVQEENILEVRKALLETLFLFFSWEGRASWNGASIVPLDTEGAFGITKSLGVEVQALTDLQAMMGVAVLRLSGLMPGHGFSDLA